MLGFLERYAETTFSRAPLCDCDRLVFAQTVYLDLSGAEKGCLLSEAIAAADFSGGDVSEVRFGFQKRDDMKLCAAVAAAGRYAGVRLIDFCRIAEDGAVFTAMTLALPDGMRLIVFRGTDNSLAGWKEDFELAYRQEIPAHRHAVEYARSMAVGADRFELIGHSKGGHLALYAATGLDPEALANMAWAVSFDGPGFSREILESRDFETARDRMRVLIPRSSIVGQLFDQPVRREFVESRLVSVMQHYPYLWKTLGYMIMPAVDQSGSARIFGKTMHGLMKEMSQADRESLIENVYSIICATKAETLNDIVYGWFSNTIPVARALLSKDRDTYRLFIRTIMAFLRSAARALNNTEEEQ